MNASDMDVLRNSIESATAKLRKERDEAREWARLFREKTMLSSFSDLVVEFDALPWAKEKL